MWRAVEIDPTGWRVNDIPPVRFRRAAGMQPLPMPVPGGSVETLRSFLNVKSGSHFILVVAWALAVLRNRGPYPVLVLSGEQGSAKATLTAILRALLDPNTAPLRALPREDRDLFIAARNGHVLAYDNVSALPAWISDTLCRLATGGGFCRAPALYRPGRGAVRRDAAGDPEWHRGHRDAARLGRPRPIPDAGAYPGGTPPARSGTLGPVRGGTPAYPGRAARCGGGGPQKAVRNAAPQVAAHGRLRAVGERMRDRDLARGHFLDRLLRKPPRSDPGRNQDGPGRHRGARVHARKDGMDGYSPVAPRSVQHDGRGG